jgi:NADH:ubiquinone oxidoreductase subunit 5 (subunit L)/multisubunit Na+/H+ antiporter MnhA subunit
MKQPFSIFHPAFFKALLFLATGSSSMCFITKNIWKMGGLSKLSKPFVTFAVGALALISCRPSADFQTT